MKCKIYRTALRVKTILLSDLIVRCSLVLGALPRVTGYHLSKLELGPKPQTGSLASPGNEADFDKQMDKGLVSEETVVLRGE